jgi:hypothetical protein
MQRLLAFAAAHPDAGVREQAAFISGYLRDFEAKHATESDER